MVASPNSGTSNEKEINEKLIHEVDFVNHQVFMELLRYIFFLNSQNRRVFLQPIQGSGDCYVPECQRQCLGSGDLRRGYVQMTKVMRVSCAL